MNPLEGLTRPEQVKEINRVIRGFAMNYPMGLDAIRLQLAQFESRSEPTIPQNPAPNLSLSSSPKQRGRPKGSKNKPKQGNERKEKTGTEEKTEEETEEETGTGSL